MCHSCPTQPCPCETSPNREAAMVTIRRGPDGTPTVWCDPCIADLVAALNAGGMPTIASCCGHGRQRGIVSLADGRDLLIIGGRDKLRTSELRIFGDPDGPPVVPTGEEP